MINIVKRNKSTLIYVCHWRSKKKQKLCDSNKQLFPFPEEGKYWTNKKLFLKKLISVEKHLALCCLYQETIKNKDCLLCGEKNITSEIYHLSNTLWDNGLKHYIDMHNIQPPDEFIELIYTHSIHKVPKESRIKIQGQKYSVRNLSYIKVFPRQLLILDALMRHGGYDKKYPDTSSSKVARYSEHAGLLDFNHEGLEKIIVSGNTQRIDVGDNEIFLPGDIKDIYDYEYIFHTHPPTPKPGGRAEYGILYELPSSGDIFHFIEHFNKGLTQGSLVMTPEGLYNIRKYEFNKKKFKIDENNLYEEYTELCNELQQYAIAKYGISFSTYYFNSVIAQDTSIIESINDLLKKYGLYIDYFPRQLKKSKKWIVDTVFLPIFITEPI